MDKQAQHKRRTSSQIRKLLNKKEQENLSVTEFCAAQQIHKATYYNWLKKYPPIRESSTKFIPIEMPAIADTAIFAEIEMPTGTIVRIHARVEPTYLKELLYP